MKKCVFCNKPAGNREHVLGQKLVERMQAQDSHVFATSRQGALFVSRPVFTPNTFTSKRVCKTCNNGWMSALEAWFLNHFGPFVEQSWPGHENALMAEALTDPVALAKWALKTAIMMDLSSLLTERVINPSIARDFFDGILPETLIVEAAHIEESTVAMFLSAGFTVWNGNRPLQWQVHHSQLAFQAVFQLNHLAFRVFCSPGAKPIYLDAHLNFPLRCYPDKEKPVRSNYRFKNMDSFVATLELQTSL